MNFVEELKQKVLAGGKVTREEALELVSVPLEALSQAADELREHFCGDRFDLCTIVNGKCGKCSEDCKYCAQSAHYHTSLEESYPLLSTEELVKGAAENKRKGVLRYSIVTSGKRLTDEDVDRLCASYRHIAEHCGISLCASHGLISKKHCEQLKAAGVSRYHNNLETSRRNFPNVCTTHTYDDKLQTIKWALEAGLEVCRGIMGLGETMEDRIDMYMDIAALGIKSMPVNFLTPIPGTPYADMTPLGEEEQLRIVALVRFIMPDGFVRIAAGRNTMKDHGRKIFMSGANAAISGDMLTTAGVTIREDLAMLAELGYEVRMK